MRFYVSFTNRRGTPVKGGTLAGNSTHTRGWNAGIKVIPRDRKDRDEFDVYMTGGTTGATGDVLIGTVHDTPNGPVFEPEFDPNNFLANAPRKITAHP